MMVVNEMKKSVKIRKRVIHFLIVMFTFFVLYCSIGIRAYAYTEEEKQQAKAWLSAHGYSPDMNGASQAYQDYLNGKFDEELGIATTEQTTAQSTEVVTESQIESATEIQENESQDAKTEKSGGISDAGVVETDGEPIDSDTVDEVSTEEATEENVEETKQIEDGADDTTETSGELTWYQEKKKDTYQQAGIVLSLSVMLMAVFIGVWQLFRKVPNKDNS